MVDPDTRCGHPMKHYHLSGRPRTDLFPRCWRPRDHADPDRHMSEYSIRKMWARAQRRRDQARVLSDPPASVAA